jgi:hypothetical protein
MYKSGEKAFLSWVISVVFVGLLSWRFDINLFSLHYYYRNRLVRCYLGASRDGKRQAQPFTGFDPNDDYKLADIRTDLGPYPIINAALNLVSGDELAWQQRKAASFVFTPKFCGYKVWNRKADKLYLELEAYRRTKNYGDGSGGKRGISVGTAMAVSGAAVSPNMGYHSSPATAFLLTVFSMRLGLWIGNPRHKKGWSEKGPSFALWPLMAELFGLTNEHRPFCNLSDGGHFENLGIYELIRRRCRFIIAIDASGDEKFGFRDLGNAIRKCRVDLDTEIVVPAAALCPEKETKRSLQHCSVGTICYPDSMTGILVYIKPTLTGNETTDILNYANEHPEFPHQSTADQWFNESQFESYRKLGYHIGCTVFCNAKEQAGKGERFNTTAFFIALRQRWYPPSLALGKAFTKHAEALDRLLERLRQSENLAFLDTQIYREWNSLAGNFKEKTNEKPAQPLGLPSTYEERREGFYFCNALLLLMECVYQDLNLEEEFEHPGNRGWMNLFRHWSWAAMVRATWSISVFTHGARFQSFCERQLGLELGEIKIEVIELKRIRQESLAEDLKKLLVSMPNEKQLNFLELKLMEEIIEGNIRNDVIANSDTLKIILLRMEVPDVSSRSPLLAFPFGFAVAYDNNLGYFRIQDHLRKTGLGSRALRVLLNDPALKGISTAKMFDVLPTSEVPKSADVTHVQELFRLYGSQSLND